MASIYSAGEFEPSEDPEQQLYDGFFGDRDRRLCEQVRNADPVELASGRWMFDDPRLSELLFRYRARNFPTTLDEGETSQWRAFCQQRLTDPAMGAPHTLEAFEAALAQALTHAEGAQQRLLLEWRQYGQEVRQRLGL